MSKLLESLYQVHENTRHARFSIIQQIVFKRKKLCWVPALICVVCFVACERQQPLNGTEVTEHGGRGNFRAKNTLNRGLPGEPRTLDPQLADDTYSFQVIRDLYEGLTAEDQTGRIVPGVARSWTVDSAGMVYTFQLRPEAKWSDGRRIVAADFVLGLRRAVDPHTASGSAAILTVIKGAADIMAGRKPVLELGVAALGELTVEIQLEHPAPFILEILSQPTSAPFRESAGSGKTGDSVTDRNPPTNGAYVLVSHVPGSFIELARNPLYWNVAGVAIEKVRYINSESEATELREYLAGQLDLTFTIPAQDVERITRQYPSQVQNEQFLATLYLALNLDESLLKNDRYLRQALSMSVDREIISNRVVTGVTPAYTIVARGVTDYKPAIYSWSTLSRDQKLDQAKMLYQRAGYSRQKPLHLRLYFNQDEGIRRLMIAIAGGWKQNLGVESELISDEFRVFLEGRKDKSRWDVARLGWTADYDDPSSFLGVFTRKSMQNDPGYTSKQFDELIDRAEREAHPQQRMDLLRNAEYVLLDDYPIIPIYFYKARRLVKPYVGGAQLTPMNRTYSKHLFWKFAT